ncbi:thioesterase II family protein [Croceitalea marina]|uniref:Thioesterase II family protein n=1 Tax=Croceitalea marina TaxID=1775166 RepID=A0ABW5MZE3_9FLAO
MSKLKLFCFPYAGGSAIIYKNWSEFLNPSIELIPIELAGRGKRIKDSFYDSIDDAVDDMFNQIKNDITGHNYVFFGHSMGALIAYELIRKIKLMKLPRPKHVFFSGRKAPHVKDEKEKKYHLMDHEEFKEEVLKLGGTPPEFFEHKALMDFMLPMLRQDFKLADVSFHDREIEPFEFNISVLLGKDEEITPEQADGWKRHTTGLCAIYYFNGGHFFLNSETEQIVELINTTVL